MVMLLIEEKEMWLQPIRAVLRPDQLLKLVNLLGDEFVDSIYVNVTCGWGKHFVEAAPVIEEVPVHPLPVTPQLRIIK